MNFQMFKLVLEKAEEPEIKYPTSAGSSKKQESSRKTSTFALLTETHKDEAKRTSFKAVEATGEQKP